MKKSIKQTSNGKKLPVPHIFKKFRTEVIDNYRKGLGIITGDQAKGIEKKLYSFFKPADIALWRNIIYDPYYYSNSREGYTTLVLILLRWQL